jgi:hypothetical protein
MWVNHRQAAANKADFPAADWREEQWGKGGNLCRKGWDVKKFLIFLHFSQIFLFAL